MPADPTVMASDLGRAIGAAKGKKDQLKVHDLLKLLEDMLELVAASDTSEADQFIWQRVQALENHFGIEYCEERNNYEYTPKAKSLLFQAQREEYQELLQMIKSGAQSANPASKSAFQSAMERGGADVRVQDFLGKHQRKHNPALLRFDEAKYITTIDGEMVRVS